MGFEPCGAEAQPSFGGGRVYWVTGLSGAGKTSLSRLLHDELKSKHSNLIFLDGDILREVLSNEYSYTLDDRFNLAMKYARICQLLSSQGINVICATISMFDKCREWNRSNIGNYVEIYVRVPIEVLRKRDQKQLYSKAERGEIENVLGVNLPFEEPKTPDIIIDNNGERNLSELCSEILNSLSIKDLI